MVLPGFVITADHFKRLPNGAFQVTLVLTPKHLIEAPADPSGIRRKPKQEHEKDKNAESRGNQSHPG